MSHAPGLDMKCEPDTVTTLSKAQKKPRAKTGNDKFPGQLKPAGYVDILATLVGEYRTQLKSALSSHNILLECIAILQDELIKSAEREASATHIAYHDGLTGLPNRRLLQDRFQQAMSNADRLHKPLAILMLDLDKFKLVNDKLGHTSGDALLQSVAERLTSSIRGADTACRYGGDEFIIMLPFIDSASSAGKLATEIGGRLSEPYFIDNHNIHMAISLGMAIYPEDGKTLEELIAKADCAMYQAKGLDLISDFSTHEKSSH